MKKLIPIALLLTLNTHSVIAEEVELTPFIYMQCNGDIDCITTYPQCQANPSCVHSLKYPEDPGNPSDTYTNEEALQAIKDGYGTPEQFYQEETINLQQKQWLELQLMPERL